MNRDVWGARGVHDQRPTGRVATDDATREEARRDQARRAQCGASTMVARVKPILLTAPGGDGPSLGLRQSVEHVDWIGDAPRREGADDLVADFAQLGLPLALCQDDPADWS